MADESTGNKMARLLDEQILKVLEQGETLRGKNGDVLLDEDGKPRSVPPSAAFLNMAAQRVKALGAKGATEEDSLARVAERARQKGGAMPELDMDDRDVAGGGV